MSLKEDVLKIIGFAENKRLKYESILPTKNVLGSTISGFANTEGGLIILGVVNRNRIISIPGISNDFNTTTVLQNAIGDMNPKPVLEYDFIEYEGRKLFAIRVDKSEFQINYKNIGYKIVGKNVEKIGEKVIKNIESNVLHDIVEHNIKNQDKIILPSRENSMSVQKVIFISYNWADKNSAQKIYDKLKNDGYTVKMDDHDLTYKGRITNFMESIRKSDYAILIISKKYLESLNCMTEVLHVMKDVDSLKKILPLRNEDVNYFSTSGRLQYLSYWKKQGNFLESELEGVDTVNAIDEYKKLKVINHIQAEINPFLTTISDMITYTVAEQEEKEYIHLLDNIRNN